MPTSPEVLAIEEAHRAAQARLGIAGAYLAVRDWGTVSVSAPVASADAWLSRSLQMINAIRRKSTRLARSYYQLARAIETGYSLGLPEYSDDPDAITMGGLRKQFLDLLLEVADLDKPVSDDRAVKVTINDPDELWFERELEASEAQPVGRGTDTMELNVIPLDDYINDLIAATDSETDDEPVGVDEYDGWEDDALTPDEIRELYEHKLLEAAQAREAKVTRLLKDEEESAKTAYAKAQKVHDAAGSVSAGAIDKAGIDGGREVITNAARHDSRVMMWARVTGPNPCAFCAMLASRGFAYKSKARASTTKGGSSAENSTQVFGGASVQSYHDNCHCYAVCRWADVDSPTAPERTAYYEKLWADQMRGKPVEQRGTENDTLNKWRRILAAQKRKEMAALRASAKA